jgi:two-component system, NarL family, response regulator LiaR
MQCKLVIADDHQLMLAAMRMALGEAPDMEIVGEADAGERLLPLVNRTSPDVVVLDLRMPGMDGLRCLELLRERHPRVKSIVMSGTDDPALVRASLARGAVAFVHKSVNPTDLPGVIRQAIEGNVVFPNGEGSPGTAPRHDGDLTTREAEILGAVAEGQSNKQIAERLWLSDQTVKYHLTNIYRKFGVSSRTEAVRRAYERGLVAHPLLRNDDHASPSSPVHVTALAAA